ncbi:hypothetical protein ABTN54_19710, partial [Acinetobacter baumannii]
MGCQISDVKTDGIPAGKIGATARRQNRPEADKPTAAAIYRSEPNEAKSRAGVGSRLSGSGPAECELRPAECHH